MTVTAALSPEAFAALASNPALPSFVSTAHGWGVVGVTVAIVAFVACLGCVLAALDDPSSFGFWVFAVLFLFCAGIALVLGLPRLLDPQGFGLQALACAAYRCTQGG